MQPLLLELARRYFNYYGFNTSIIITLLIDVLCALAASCQQKGTLMCLNFFSLGGINMPVAQEMRKHVEIDIENDRRERSIRALQAVSNERKD